MYKDRQQNLDIISFGCRLNIAESQIMQHMAEKAGLDNSIIINSCAVTSEAERQLRQKLRQLRTHHPEKKLILSGCAAQISPEYYHHSKLVDAVIGNDKKLMPETYHHLKNTKNNQLLYLVDDIDKADHVSSYIADNKNSKTRAFVNIQNGCDHDCTFCIIPQGRGKSRSLTITNILKQIEHHCQQGSQEIILCGVDLTSWSDGHNKTLGNVVMEILKNFPQLLRLRLSSLDCIEIDDILLDAFANEMRLLPHIHLSVQSGNDMILKRMKRRHNRQDIVKICQQLRQARPDMIIGADFITGFPTETDIMFSDTVSLVKECDLSLLHVFPFSPRPGTPAAKIPDNKQVPVPTRKARAKILRDTSKEIMIHAMKQQIGSIQPVLFEKNNIGHTPHFFTIRHDDIHEGNIIEMHLTDIIDDDRQPYFIGDICHV